MLKIDAAVKVVLFCWTIFNLQFLLVLSVNFIRDSDSDRALNELLSSPKNDLYKPNRQQPVDDVLASNILPDIQQDRSLSDLRKVKESILLMELIKALNQRDELARKRSCRLNLGGHCSTENAAFVADRWHYFNSPESPGRRKRHLATPSRKFNSRQ